MHETFTYKETFFKSYCFPAIVFAALAVISAVSGRGLRIKKSVILAYPYSLYFFIFFTAGFGAYAYYKYSRAKKSAANSNPIKITDDMIYLPKGESGLAAIKLTEITAVKEKDRDDAWFLLKTNNESYKFFESGFESREEFTKFEETLKERIAVQLKAS